MFLLLHNIIAEVLYVIYIFLVILL